MFSFEPAEHSHKHDNGDGTEDQLCDELRIREAVQREQPIQHKQRGDLQHDLAQDGKDQGDFSGADKIRILFELCQYKFMFKQDSSAKEHIRRIFGEGMTFSQVESIPFLEQGENVLSIAGAGALQFRVWLSRDYEATLFSGGR